MHNLTIGKSISSERHYRIHQSIHHSPALNGREKPGLRAHHSLFEETTKAKATVKDFYISQRNLLTFYFQFLNEVNYV